MHASPLTWLTRLLWFTLPLTLGDLVAAALDDRVDAVRLAGTSMWWLLWAAGLLTSLVMSIPSLIVLRVLAPAPLLVAICAAITTGPTTLGWVGLATAAVVAVAAMSAEVGMDFVNATSYGDERRFPLRAPAVLVLGPVQLVWLLAVFPAPAGVLLIADGTLVPGLIALVVGGLGIWWATVTLTRLATRWAVFVPAGLTIVDPMALMDPVLFRRELIGRLEPALDDTTAVDLTAGAPGLVLELDLAAPVMITPAVRRDQVAAEIEVTAVLITPSRPGGLIAHATSRDVVDGRA